jgi:hypothetical protein
MRFIFSCVTVLIAVVLLGSCKQQSFVDVPKQRSVLIDGIRSYSRVDEIRSLLGSLTEKWEVVENSGQTSANDPRPPFRIYATVIHGYQHLGFTGDLKLTFFNDRLMSATFYPDDFEGYVKRVRTTVPQLAESKSVPLPPHSQVTLGTDYQQRKYISWEDARLVEEMSIWIKRYS